MPIDPNDVKTVIEGVEKSSLGKIIVRSNPGSMNTRELVEAFDVNSPGDAVGKELTTRYNTQVALIFHSNGQLNKHLTIKELERLDKGYAARATAIHDGFPHKTYPIGSKPPVYVDQNPYDGKPLDKDDNGVSMSDAGVPWGELNLDTRRLVFLASPACPAAGLPVDTSDSKTFSLYGELELFEELFEAARPNSEAEKKGGEREKSLSFKRAIRLFPNTYPVFQNLSHNGELPSMKVALPANAKSSVSNSPSAGTGSPSSANSATGTGNPAAPAPGNGGPTS